MNYENKMMIVDVATKPSFIAGKPRVLFEGAQQHFGGIPVRAYDTDRKRFLSVENKQRSEAPPVTRINIVLNLFEELERLVPAGKKYVMP